MPWNGSGIYGQTLIVDPLGAEQSGLDLVLGSFRVALYTDDRPDPDYSSTSPVYITEGEVVGTGYVAGGTLLTGTTLTHAGGVATWDADDVTWSGTTLSGVRGCDIYWDDDPAKPLVCGIDFQISYNTSDGDLTLAINPLGIITSQYA